MGSKYHTHQVLNVKVVVFLFWLSISWSRKKRLPGSPNLPDSSAGSLGMRLDRSIYHLKWSQTIFPSVFEKLFGNETTLITAYVCAYCKRERRGREWYI